MQKEIIWPFIYLSYFSIFCLGFADNIRGPVFAQILKNFSLSDGQGAWFFSICSLFAFAGSVLAHFLVKKIDRIQGVRLALLFFVIGNFLIGYAQPYWLVLAGASIVGTSFGLMGILQNVLVTLAVSAHRRQQFITGLHAVYGLSSLIAPMVAAYILDFRSSWREVFYIASIIPILVLLYTLTFKTDLFKLAKKNNQLENTGERLWTIDKIYIASVIAIYSMVEIMMATRLSLYLQRKYNYTVANASLSLSYFFLVFLFGRILFSLKPLKYPVRKQIAVMLFISVICLSLGFYKYPLLLILSGFFMAPCYPFCVGYMTDVYSKELDSIMLVAFVMQGLFVVGMHSTVGYLSDWIGLDKALWFGPIFLFVGFLMLITFESFYNNKHKKILN